MFVARSEQILLWEHKGNISKDYYHKELESISEGLVHTEVGINLFTCLNGQLKSYKWIKEGIIYQVPYSELEYWSDDSNKI